MTLLTAERNLWLHPEGCFMCLIVLSSQPVPQPKFRNQAHKETEETDESTQLETHPAA